MGVKFKNQNNTLKVFFYSEIISDDYGDNAIETYHISANTMDEAVEIWIDKFSDIKWQDKTREDFTRKDYWEAWLDHNREKTYKTYLKRLSKEKKRLYKDFKELPGIFYIGQPSVILESEIEL